MKTCELFVRSGLCESKTKARQLIIQGGAKIQDIKITDPNSDIFFFDDSKHWVLVEQTRVLEFMENGEIFETPRTI
jgi:tyrosyl-tRNA synthetase